MSLIKSCRPHIVFSGILIPKIVKFTYISTNQLERIVNNVLENESLILNTHCNMYN